MAMSLARVARVWWASSLAGAKFRHLGSVGRESSALRAALPYRRDLHERSDHVSDSEPQCLHAMEMMRESAIDAARDEFVQPRHQHAGAVFAKPEHLRGFAVESLQ